MIEVKIDKERGANMQITLSGSTHDMAQETAIMLVEICKAISCAADEPFNKVFTAIVGTAKHVHFSRGEEGQNEH
jgi:hypothetical protein